MRQLDIDWPEHELCDIEVGRSPRNPDEAECWPLFDRKPSGLWCELWSMLAANDDLITWNATAGVVLCDYSQLPLLRDRLTYLTDVTNEAWVQYVLAMPAHEAALLLEDEADRAAAADRDGEWSRIAL
jgi:hypothetical protein